MTSGRSGNDSSGGCGTSGTGSGRLSGTLSDNI